MVAPPIGLQALVRGGSNMAAMDEQVEGEGGGTLTWQETIYKSMTGQDTHQVIN